MNRFAARLLPGRLGRWPLLALVFLGACSTLPSHGYYQHDGPLGHVDVRDIQNAVPRSERLSATGNAPYRVLGHEYYPMKTACGYRARGIASWYGRQFYKGRTSDGERYNMFAMTAAHKTLPLPSYVRVTNLRNGRTVVVRVNDRGPFLNHRLIDLSYAAAAKLGMLGSGTAPVEVVADNVGCAASVGPVIQVGSFAERYRAVRLVQTLERDMIGPVHVSVGTEGRTRWYRVQVGPFKDSAMRAEMMRRLRRHQLPVSDVVTTP